jgi:predicted metal-dependent hydrolase
MVFQTVLSLLGDRDTYRPRVLVKSLRRFLKSPVVSRKVWRQLKDYNRRDFHPDDSDATALVERWEAELFGEHGTLNDLLAGRAGA